MKATYAIALSFLATLAYTQTPPGPRHLEEIAIDTEKNELILSGGGEMTLGSGTIFPDYLSEWNGTTWTNFESAGPKNRYGHALVYDEHEKAAFLIGGVNEATRTIPLDVWKWKDKKWKLVSSDCPVKTLEATYDPINRRVLVYGDAYNKTELRKGGDPLGLELWEFKSNTWKKLSAEGPQISSQYEIAFDTERNALVIPVWENGKSVVWEWENMNWRKIANLEKSPEERNRFALAFHNQEKTTYLFGGRNDANPFLNDVWTWDGKKWTAVLSQEIPPARAAALMEYGNDGLYLYGGVAAWGLSNEIWRWQNSNWTLLNGDYAMTEDKTSKVLKEWLSLHPEDVEALTKYGTLLGKQKVYDGAVTHLKKAHAINPVDHNILINLCDVLYEQGKDTEAKNYILEAVQTGKMQRNSYTRLAYYFLSTKKFDVSAWCFEKALAMEPQAGDFYNLACAYALLKESDKAFEALTKSMENGFDSKEQLERDTDLESLRSDARWKVLVEKLK